MDLRDAMESTGTCRFYRPDPVPDDLLRRVLDATRWAPTGGNRQGVRFVAVRDASRRRQLAAYRASRASLWGWSPNWTPTRSHSTASR